MSKNQTFCISITNPSEKDLEILSDIMADYQDEYSKLIQEEAKEIGVSYGAMADVFYARERSWHTDRLERYIIHLDKNKLPGLNLMNGDWQIPESFQ